MTKEILVEILMGPKPGTKLRYYGETGIEEFDRLDEVQQDPKWHPEGSVKIHTCHVLDAMSKICNEEKLVYKRKITLMLAALCHDMGKYVSTFWHKEKAKWVAYGHEITGAEITWDVLSRYDFSNIEPNPVPIVLLLVRYHMTHTRNSFSDKSVQKLLKELDPASMEDLILLMRADCAGRPPLSPELPDTITNQLIPLYRKIIEYGKCNETYCRS